MRGLLLLFVVGCALSAVSIATVQTTPIKGIESGFLHLPSASSKNSFLKSLQSSQRSKLSRSNNLSNSWVSIRNPNNANARNNNDNAKLNYLLLIFEEEGVTIERWVRTSGSILTAMVTYEGQPSFVKCTLSTRYKIESNAYKLMNKNKALLVSEQERDGEQWIVKLLHSFDYDCCSVCFVLSRDGDLTLLDYMYEATWEHKAEVMPRFTSQLVRGIAYLHRLGLAHSDIKTENILVNTNHPSGKPHIAIIDFDLSVPLKYQDSMLVPQGAYGGTFGYYAPEEAYNDYHNLMKRDSWQIGSTIYDALMGVPPYGYTIGRNGSQAMSDMDYAIQLEQVFDLRKNTCRAISASNEILSKLTSVTYVMEQLMTVKPQYRPTPQKMVDQKILVNPY
ncbi:kinase-like domain-containing protein [Syncephalis fuscata]|nr:kinase-like domain-containing protein [Syncephalis fuscata]